MYLETRIIQKKIIKSRHKISKVFILNIYNTYMHSKYSLLQDIK
jgi:hypothetical protein